MAWPFSEITDEQRIFLQDLLDKCRLYGARSNAVKSLIHDNPAHKKLASLIRSWAEQDAMNA